MIPLDFINLTTVSAVLMFIGAIGTIMLPKPLDKIIMFALLQAGFIGSVASAKYLDVAMAAAIFDPIATVIFIMAIVKINEIREKQKSQEEEALV